MSQKRSTLSTGRTSRSSPMLVQKSNDRLSTTSPVSPTRSSRLQEKEELQHLNDRLACYIDRMRNLENENNRLTQEVQLAQDTVTRETTNMKVIYEKELNAARKLLDETSKEKAKLEIDIKRLWEENDDLKQRYLTRERFSKCIFMVKTFCTNMVSTIQHKYDIIIMFLCTNIAFIFKAKHFYLRQCLHVF